MLSDPYRNSNGDWSFSVGIAVCMDESLPHMQEEYIYFSETTSASIRFVEDDGIWKISSVSFLFDIDSIRNFIRDEASTRTQIANFTKRTDPFSKELSTFNEFVEL
jgi:hypothetical protein